VATHQSIANERLQVVPALGVAGLQLQPSELLLLETVGLRFGAGVRVPNQARLDAALDDERARTATGGPYRFARNPKASRPMSDKVRPTKAAASEKDVAMMLPRI
jgi:hypothetical protein